jgi:predicted alpha/beta-fold hydrolase
MDDPMMPRRTEEANSEDLNFALSLPNGGGHLGFFEGGCLA